MDRQTFGLSIRTFLRVMRQRLDEAAGLAKAAEACADADSHDKAVEITHDIEPLLYDVTTLLNAASLMRRILNPD